MKWCNQLFVGKEIKYDIDKLKQKINNGKWMLGYHLICLPSNHENLFDIHSVIQLKQKYYSYFEPTVIGIAKSKENAFELVRAIIDKIYKETGQVNVKQYLIDKNIIDNDHIS